MNRIFVLLFAILFFSNAFPQNFIIKGEVVDSIDNIPLSGANIILYHLPDSVMRGMAANRDGRFTLENIRPGNYALHISFVGYNTNKREIVVTNSNINLGKIFLSRESVKIDEVVVAAQAIPVIQKGDTSEYNAEAFKTRPDATAEDLIAKMPGVTVREGKIQAQGEDIKQMLVDGRPFFADDPNAVLKNLPAEIIDRIQIFDQLSEQAQFTGFDDGNTTKTLNIVTRMRIREGTFGRVAAGYGNDEKYKAGGNINFFSEDQRITLLGQLNNVNEQNFSSEDLLGVMSSSGGGGRRPGGMRQRPGGGGGGGFSGRSWGGGDASEFRVSTQNGLNKTYALGLNYSNKWGEELELSGSYFFNLSDNNLGSVSFREYFLESDSGQNYRENNLSSSKNINHRFNLKFDYRIDSSQSFTFRPRLSIQQNDGSSMITGITSSGVAPLNSISNLFNSELSAINNQNEMVYRYRFETRGRSLSLSLNSSYTRNTGESDLFAENIFYRNIASSDTSDQYSGLTRDGFGLSSNISFTEPISENGQLQLTTGFSHNQDESDKKTYQNLLQISLLDTSLSNVYKRRYQTQTYGAGYRWSLDGLSINLNLSYRNSQLKNSQEFPLVTDVKRNFSSVLPSFNLRYNISRDQNLRIFYRTDNNSPSVDQLQNVIDNSNPISLRMGNPSLEQDYRHYFSVRYSFIDFSNMHSFFILLGGTITNNYIGNQTTLSSKDSLFVDGILLSRGVQLTKPVNLDGYISLRSFVTYGLPINFLMSNVNLNLGVTYSRTPSIINSTDNFTNSINYNLGFVLSSNIGKELDYTLSSSSGFNVMRNDLQTTLNRNYFTQNTSAKLFWMFWETLFIQVEGLHQYNSGLSDDYAQNSVIMGASIGTKLFSNERGEIRFTAYDMLNKNSNIQRNVTDTYYEDTRSNVLGGYFMLSFIYNLREFN